MLGLGMGKTLGVPPAMRLCVYNAPARFSCITIACLISIEKVVEGLQ